MSSRLGRNPFQPGRESVSEPKSEESAELVGDEIDLPEGEDEDSDPRWFSRLAVDLPAEAFVFSLKARMLFRSVFK